MNVMPMLACGPGPGFVILIYAVLGGGAVALGSFISGAILSIAGHRGLGLSLISFSIILGAALLFWLRIL
jgi:hypothetical protein